MNRIGTTNFVHYLPIIIIGLLSVALVCLIWMFGQARRKQKQLEQKIRLLELDTPVKTEPEIKSCVENPNNIDKTCQIEIEHIPENLFVAHVDQLIIRNISSSEFTANTIADILHLSRTQLDRRMKQLVGKTISAYLLDRRMMHARELLLTSDMPIVDVAVKCGFDDTSYFSRVFRNYHSKTPSDVRKEERKD